MRNFAEEHDRSIDEIIKTLWDNRFDPSKPLPERPDYKFSIIGKDGKEYGMGTRGAIIQVSGKSKTRKSTLMAIFAAAAISPTRQCLNVRANFPYDTGIYYWMDTEQTEEEFYYFQRMVWRLSGREGTSPGRYAAIHLRPYSEDERYQIIDRIMTGSRGRVAAVFMDGIADFVMNSNEQEATRSLVTRVGQWTDFHGCPLFAAIHTNKDGKESTGTLGGFLDKKCSVHLRTEIATDDGPTRVTSKLNRGGGRIPPFEFLHGPEGIPVMMDSLGIVGDGEYDDDNLPQF
jgi:hypothetical protein